MIGHLKALDEAVSHGPARATPEERALVAELSAELGVALTDEDGTPTTAARVLVGAAREALLSVDAFFRVAEALTGPDVGSGSNVIALAPPRAQGGAGAL